MQPASLPAQLDPQLAVTERDVDALYRRIGLRLLPLLALSYMLAYMDRVNISFAKAQMQAHIGLSESAYGFAAGVFFIGYVIFEVPSNLLLVKIGARRTLSRIMVLWGIASASMLFVREPHTFYALRFLLGVFEAGFGPGLLYYLTLWYGPKRRARVMAYLLLASPVAGIIGGPLSTLIMTSLDGVAGLWGWQWLFLVEGTPCVLIGILLFFVLDDGPQHARWLSAKDRQLVAREVSGEKAARHSGLAGVARDWRVYALSFSYFCMISGLYAISFWLPTLLRAVGVTRPLAIGFLAALPYIAAVITMVSVAIHSDRSGEQRWHSSISCLIAAALLFVTASNLHNVAVALPALVVATGAIYAGYTVFWAIPANYLKGAAAAGGLAFINSVGLIGGFVSPLIIGRIKDATGSLQAGLSVIAALLALGAVMLACNRVGNER
ncbi:MFS transporter [Paraburkholderia susongensis]|uniref:Sugar phosphate permease n=1 Tax=Paraburkholderia susongensis TaxID=1515439 RepID=A0A1X7LJ38_9BURK|nr:MFS transporter [Paraburkholderia susongensis]SMG53199.1 Sugar phosphate permease [Paraburkholderia susongensis]